MLLEDFKRTKARKFRRVNKLLSEQYGISLSINIPMSDLKRTRKNIYEQIQLLKIKGSVSGDCPILSKNLLILEGIGYLIEKTRLDEMRSNFTSTGPFIRVVTWLSDFVAKNVELGDDLDDAMVQALREYRSSKWRFPDEFIEFYVRESALKKIQTRDSVYTTESVNECGCDDGPMNSFMGQDDVENARSFIMVPASTLGDSARGKLHDYYSGQGQTPGDDDWYYNQLVNDFNPQLRGNVDENTWDSILDKSGRYKPHAQNPKTVDRLSGDFSLEPAPPKYKDKSAGRTVNDGHAAYNRKQAASKKRRGVDESPWDDVLDKSGRYKPQAKNPKMVDKLSGDFSLEPAPPKYNDKSSGRTVNDGHAAYNRKQAASKKRRGVDESPWDEVLDKSGRYKPQAKNPKMVDKLSGDFALEPAPPKYNDKSSGRSVNDGHAAYNRKRAASKRKQK